MGRAGIPSFARLRRQIVFGNLLGSDAEPDELHRNSGIEVLPELGFERDIDQHPSGVVITDVENDQIPAVMLGVDLLGCLKCEGDAAEATSRIKGNGELATIVLDHAGDRAGLSPNLAVSIGL